MRNFLRWATVMVQAALFIVATTVVFIPSTRTHAMHVALISLFWIVAIEGFWSIRQRRVLRMTPAQIYASYDPRNPRATLLGTAASIMGAVAIFIS